MKNAEAECFPNSCLETNGDELKDYAMSFCGESNHHITTIIKCTHFAIESDH